LNENLRKLKNGAYGQRALLKNHKKSQKYPKKKKTFFLGQLEVEHQILLQIRDARKINVDTYKLEKKHTNLSILGTSHCFFNCKLVKSRCYDQAITQDVLFSQQNITR